MSPALAGAQTSSGGAGGALSLAILQNPCLFQPIRLLSRSPAPLAGISPIPLRQVLVLPHPHGVALDGGCLSPQCGAARATSTPYAPCLPAQPCSPPFSSRQTHQLLPTGAPRALQAGGCPSCPQHRIYPPSLPGFAPHTCTLTPIKAHIKHQPLGHVFWIIVGGHPDGLS